MTKTGFRFKVGQKVWVRDRREARGGYRIVEATVADHHYHPGRHPWYPNGEGYDLDGDLWWSCYPGLRVFATRADAIAGRLPKTAAEAEVLAFALRKQIRKELKLK